MIEMSKKYRTVSGEDVELIATTGRGEFPVKGYVGKDDFISAWDINGRFCGIGPGDKFDLVEVKTEVTLWANLYLGDRQDIIGWVYHTEEGANYGGGKDRIACVQITVPEGTFD